jgi:uncharacterized damage-inducible protein DinB
MSAVTSMKLQRLLPLSLLLCLAWPVLSRPLQNTPKVAAPAPTGFRAEFLANLDDVQNKILSIAEATPADKFAWRPAPGVRSISEVYMHIAGGNYFLATFVGLPAPRNKGDIEKTVTKKADVIAELKRSFEHLRTAANSVTNLEKPTKMFGAATTNRGVMITMLSHLHEHLGQSVAYGRMNGVTPPWSH